MNAETLQIMACRLFTRRPHPCCALPLSRMRTSSSLARSWRQLRYERMAYCDLIGIMWLWSLLKWLELYSRQTILTVYLHTIMLDRHLWWIVYPRCSNVSILTMYLLPYDVILCWNYPILHFLFTYCIEFVPSQTWLTLIKSVERYNNNYTIQHMHY